MRNLIASLCILLLTACAATAGVVNEKNMGRAAADLHRLSYAVQGEILRGAASGEDLVALACGRDAALCAALADFHIAVKKGGNSAVLLLCSKDQRRALLENIACTANIEFSPWEKGTLPCVFTLDATSVCP